MKQQMTILSATRGNVEGTAYSSTWCATSETENKADLIGNPPMKINCDANIIDSLRGKLPATFMCKVKMISGGGARGGLFISEVDPMPVVLPVTASGSISAQMSKG
jgi:hypothetical protein